MVSPEERPEDLAGFKIPDLRGHVTQHRPALVVAALTAVRAWFVAGQPDMDLPAWGSFEAWSGVVRNALVWAGWADPAESREAMRADEAEDLAPIAAMHVALAALCVASGGPVTGAQIADAANAGLHGLVAALAGLPGRAVEGLWTGKVVGYRLRRHKDRVVAGRALKIAAPSESGSLWSIT